MSEGLEGWDEVSTQAEPSQFGRDELEKFQDKDWVGNIDMLVAVWL